MNEKEILPEHVFERYKSHFGKKYKPSIIRTKNIVKDGIDTLVSKNRLLWSFSTYENEFKHIEGIIHWGSSTVYIYFNKLDDENTYKLYIINDHLDDINLLLVGLNKFFTIDKI